MRIGLGYDIHRLVEGRKLYLGGQEIRYAKGLLGHSDADVLIHAVIDALLGAAALGDIGRHFPDTDPKYEGVNSVSLLQCTRDLLEQRGYIVQQVDCIVIAEKPKLASHIPKMEKAMAQALRIFATQVSVKAKTNEGLGPIGAGEAIAAYAIATDEYA